MAKRPSLRDNLNTDEAAAAADAIAGKGKAKGRGIAPDDEPHSTQSYHIPTRQIELLARVAMERAMAARHAGKKGQGRISASGVLREIIERHIGELQDELDGK